MSSSNAVLAQNATQLAQPTPNVSDTDLIASIVARNMQRKVKPGTITSERLLLNKSKLFSACAAEYKSRRAISKNDRLDDETAKELDGEIDKQIEGQLDRIHARNALSFREYLHHDMRNRRITKRVQATGEDAVSLKEQLLGIDIVINSLEKRLEDLFKKKTPDYVREQSVKDSIREAEFTRTFIRARIEDISKTGSTGAAVAAELNK